MGKQFLALFDSGGGSSTVTTVYNEIINNLDVNTTDDSEMTIYDEMLILKTEYGDGYPDIAEDPVTTETEYEVDDSTAADEDTSTDEEDSSEITVSALRVVIDSLLETYADELSDDNSDTYKLFMSLTEVNTYNQYIVFRVFLNSLYQNVFTIDQILQYFEDYDMSICYKSVVIFLASLYKYKRTAIKNRLYNGLYPENGNLISFFNKLYSDNTNLLFYRTVETDMILKDDNYFMLDPNINYFGDPTECYRSRRLAEVDYWSMISTYNDANAYTVGDNVPLQDIVKYVRERTYNSKAKGTPVFLRKEYQKVSHLENVALNKTIMSILKDSYAALSDKDVLHFINKMADDFVTYYNESTTPTFDYSAESLELPQFIDDGPTEGFLTYKMTNFIETHDTIENITLYELKEMTFYILGIFKFVLHEDTIYEDLRTDLLAEYDTVKTMLLDIWSYLSANGKYK